MCRWFIAVALIFPSAAFASIKITSPAADSTSISAVRITAYASETGPFHLEVWDNGTKLGNVFSLSEDQIYVLPSGPHTLTVQAVNPVGSVIDKANLTYDVAEPCQNSANVTCDLEATGVNNTPACNPGPSVGWIATTCEGVEGDGSNVPVSTGAELVNDAERDQGEIALNGSSLYLSERQEAGLSNVLFRGQSPWPLPAKTLDTHWGLDEYVYLPDPEAHQAFEMDAQAVEGGIWTKFYTECAFNINKGTGYWGVFDSNTGGWIFLNGQTQGGQTPPVVPCNRSQFSQPWTGSSDPGFTGWHHIAWSFLRMPDGTVTYESLTFDGNTTQVNFHPNSGTGGAATDNGNFGALIQLDGVSNADASANTVDAYLDEVDIAHTP